VKKRSDEQGFTLLELMVVVAIIAIIASILMPNFFHARAQAAVSACESNIRAISTAAELFYSDNQAYPKTTGIDPVDNTFGTEKGAAPGQYLSQQPKDPANGTNGLPGQYVFANTTNGGAASYTITCGGVHDSSALTAIPLVPAGSSFTHVFYDSAKGFSAQ
jgi:type II secretion system protein G